MESEMQIERLLGFFKALADESRLKIIGLLAQEPRSVDELAAMLKLSSPTVSHHLSYLQHEGLVEARAQQYYSVYSLRIDTLHSMARDILSNEKLAEVAVDVDQDAYAKKVMASYMVNGKLKQIPTQLKKLEVIIRWLSKKFEPDRTYTEKQVNEILKQYHEDYATLRRELVDMHYLDRKNGLYWCVGSSGTQPPAAQP
ncbi:MAG: metalloregulator ArsR/SmtB family transcription factor [Chloroflexi bacterium]|nr:metalloregulator ArsR/SmtB family transcription factor [Chloroflexota bacterium]